MLVLVPIVSDCCIMSVSVLSSDGCCVCGCVCVCRCVCVCVCLCVCVNNTSWISYIALGEEYY